MVGGPIEYLVALETQEVDPSLKHNECRLIYQTGRTEICRMDTPEFLERKFNIGAKDN